jgi:transcriptional regulator with XRE-family HTH domain
MPNIDDAAKAWQLELAKRVGAAVKDRRTSLKMTAQQLAERTKGLGYPVTRVAISKMESNSRAGKLDIAELLILAAALEVPPVVLLFPEIPDGKVRLFPEVTIDSDGAVRWFSGLNLPFGLLVDKHSEIPPYGTPNPSHDLLEAISDRREAIRQLLKAGNEQVFQQQVEELELEVRRLNAKITSLGGVVVERSDGDFDDE